MFKEADAIDGTSPPADHPSSAVNASAAPPKVAPSRRPFAKAVMMWVRRGHLYIGLFLFPWAILYGITAFLFNHPTAFSDQPTTTFTREALLGTPLETLPSAQSIAEQVVGQLNETLKPETPYTLAGDAKFGGRDFAFATVKAEGNTISLLLDVRQGWGTIRSTPVVEAKTPEVAPFAIGRAAQGGTGGREIGRADGAEGVDAIKLETSFPEQLKGVVPVVLERCGFPTGEVTVTSVPDVVFPIDANGRVWTATYNQKTGAVTGTPDDAKPAVELSWRRFLLRLHLAHGYPGEVNARWGWALIVDAMAFTMCFWGISGLLMWWQIKATRKLGLVILLLSAVTATVLGIAMHTTLTT